MLTRTWKIWLGVLLGIAAVTGGLYALLWSQGYTIGANIVSILAVLAIGGWALRGLYVWREVTWVRRVNSFVIAAFVFGLLYVSLRAVGAPSGAQRVLYTAGTVAGFMLGINLLRLALIPGGPILGVARAMIEEAIRLRIALIFITMLLVGLPALAAAAAGDDRLTYIVQRFLTYALILVSFLLSVMTVILASYTTSRDIKQKLVHMTLTKPLGRPQYLLGKWLGIMMLNAVLLAVSGVAIAGFTRVLADGQAMNPEDREQVQKEVLTARIAQVPVPIEGTVDEMVERTLRGKQTMEPERFGEPGSPASALPERVYQEVFSEALATWFTINPSEYRTYRFTGLEAAQENARKAGLEAEQMLMDLGMTAEQARGFVQTQNMVPGAVRPDVDIAQIMTAEQFDEIMATINSEKVQFSINPYTTPEPADAMVVMLLNVNGRNWPVRDRGRGGQIRQQGDVLPDGVIKVAVDAPSEMALPAWLIDEEGVLEVTIAVPAQRPLGQAMIDQTPIQLNRKDAVPEIFYRVGSFEGNIARSMAVLWVRLGFLAMFGLLVGSLFSFPVACLAGMLVYVIAAFSGFLSEAVTSFSSVQNADTTWGVVSGAVGNFFGALSNGAIGAAFKLLIGLFAKIVMLLIPSFGEFNPGPELADGKIVPTSMLLSALLRIGLLWTGVVSVIGLFFFHKRELARVTV
ncbi:MAG: ABC transporter permease [Phycisphaerales bacterium JB063]